MEIVSQIKELIRQSINVSSFSDIEFGEVVSESPLKIKLNEIITLEEENLILTNAVKEHTVDITVGWLTEDKNIDGLDNHTHPYIDTTTFSTNPSETQPSPGLDSTHKHKIIGKKKIIIHNNLKENEKVLLIKAIGGQKYVVIDRLTDFNNEGQWEE